MVSSTVKFIPGIRRSLIGARLSRGGVISVAPQCLTLTAASLLVLLLLFSSHIIPGREGSPSSLAEGTKAEDGEQEEQREMEEVAGMELNSLAALKQIESLFPKEVAEMMRRSTESQQSLEDLKGTISREESPSGTLRRIREQRRLAHSLVTGDPLPQQPADTTEEGHRHLARAAAEGEDPDTLQSLEAELRPDPNDPARAQRAALRERQREQRVQELMKVGRGGRQGQRRRRRRGAAVRTSLGATGSGTGMVVSAGGAASERKQRERKLVALPGGVFNDIADGGAAASLIVPAAVWGAGSGQPDQMLRLMRDQVIMARAYASVAMQSGSTKLGKEIKLRIKDSLRTLGDAEVDSELPQNYLERMRAMGQVLSRAKEKHFDCPALVKRLRALVHASDDQNQALRRQGLFLSQLAARTIPKGLFCLAMRLTVEYAGMSPEQRDSLPGRDRLEDPRLHHYALFSDNVLACAVVVNSTVTNCKNSSDQVFHIVTDKLNYGAIKAWFLLNPPKDAALEVMNIDEFKWLNASYCPVLRQLETASMKQYYFKMEQAGGAVAGGGAEAGGSEGSAGGEVGAAGAAGMGAGSAAAASNLKYRNPKYLSMLNHLRFYLPEVFPKLDKILFLDDDIVVQRDLTLLWEVDLRGKVNGAVETCGTSFHRFDKYLNFSNPLISSSFDPQACGWAYGMNVFDLRQWRKKDITGIYHHWQNLNEERTLWKLGTLPPGLITFYNLTHTLDRHWHVLGLGYNPNLDMAELHGAAVVHYNGNLKPWLEISLSQFKPFWTKYVNTDSPFLQQCNIQY